MKMGATKYDLWIRDGGRCSACNVVIDKIDIAHMQYDHILPRSLPYAIDELFTGKEHDILSPVSYTHLTLPTIYSV